MNARKLFNKTMNYKKPERLFIWHWKFGLFDDGGSQFWQATVKRWHQEGLPSEINTARNINEFFGVDEYIQIDNIMYDLFSQEKIIEENEKFIVRKTGVGKEIIKEFKGSLKESSMMEHISYPITEHQDWELIKDLLDPDLKERYNTVPDYLEYMGRFNSIDDIMEKSTSSNIPIGIRVGSLYGWLRNWLGVEKISYLLYDDLAFLEEMMDYITEYIIEVLKRSTSGKKFKIDFANFWEDMAGKDGPLLSPKHFEQLMVPRYKRITKYLREEMNVDVIMVDSDGNIEKLIPLWLKSGINCVYPLEVAAGMDVVKLREKYGKDLLMIGGIDKRILATSKNRIKREVERVLPVFESGGYIPAVDHSVPPDVPFENYMYYHNLLKEECNKS